MRVASTPLARLRGLIGRRDPGPLLLPRTRAIHTCFMRVPIDAVFLDASGRPVKVVRVAPWRFAAARGARAVLEVPVRP
jgi:hypothetical protein